MKDINEMTESELIDESLREDIRIKRAHVALLNAQKEECEAKTKEILNRNS